MGTVIGPIDHEWWHTMLMLRRSIKEDQDNNNDGSRDLCIRKEQAILKECLGRFLPRVA